MSKNKFNNKQAQHDMAEGSRPSLDSFDNRSAPPSFVRMVVLEVIFDPQSIDEKKLSYWEHLLKIKNIRFGKVLPRNTIIGQRVLMAGATASDLPMFLFPFFPSHLSLPCKPGEHVWVTFEHPDAKYSEIGYWMCRITEPHFVDDVNHTHSPRNFDKFMFVPGTEGKFNGKSDIKYEFRNGSVDEIDGERYTPSNSAQISSTENAYEKLITETDASKVTQYESVPRFRKRPGDVAFEGSNNTLIVLGTDRSGHVSEIDDQKDDDFGKNHKQPENDLFGQAGSIDMVSGRGQTEKTGGTKVTSKTVQGIDFKEEIGKSVNELQENEGDPDYSSDRSRVLNSQRMLVDEKFNLKSHNEENLKDVKDYKDGDGAIVIKSDKVRIIARSDVQILVSRFERNTDGKMVEQTDIKKFASMTIRGNGDIIFIPAEDGVIKLGGDDANLAILCQKATTGPNDNSGHVTAPPIIDTMFGSQGGGGISGEFAKKVLIK